MSESPNEKDKDRRLWLRQTALIVIAVLLIAFGMIGCQIHADSVKQKQIETCVKGGGTWQEGDTFETPRCDS